MFNPKKLNQLREKEALSCRRFALKLGVSPGTMSRVLSGKFQPSPKFLQLLKNAYPDISLDKFFD